MILLFIFILLYSTFQRCSYLERPNFESFSKLNDHLRTLYA